jgi:hypothetical protein
MLVASIKTKDKAARVKAIARARAGDRSYYTVERLGKTQTLTPEGFLLCTDVPIARTGTLLYGEGETPLNVGKDGIVKIDRDPDEVFRKETLASFEGKPVTLEHPDEDVNPENFKEHVVGVTQNVRQGKGIEDDLILSDLLIQDKEAIDAVRDGIYRELSCGYDADYEQTGPGRGRQLNIIGNHVALVKQGRAGSRCAIQDRRTIMAKKGTKDLAARFLDAFKSRDAMELKEAMKDAGVDMDPSDEGEDKDGDTHVHVHLNSSAAPKVQKPMADEKEDKVEDEEGGTEALMKEIHAMLTKLCGTEDEEYEGDDKEEEGGEVTDSEFEEGDTYDEDEEEDKEPKKTKDGKSVVRDTKARLEILSPGFRMPTLDSKDPKKARDALSNAKRKALDKARATHDFLKPMLGHVKLKTATNDTISALFLGASELVKQHNNASGGNRSTMTTKDFGGSKVTPADINKKNEEFWSNRSKSA